jgi:hypothetical protein
MCRITRTTVLAIVEKRDYCFFQLVAECIFPFTRAKNVTMSRFSRFLVRERKSPLQITLNLRQSFNFEKKELLFYVRVT